SPLAYTRVWCREVNDCCGSGSSCRCGWRHIDLVSWLQPEPNSSMVGTCPVAVLTEAVGTISALCRSRRRNFAIDSVGWSMDGIAVRVGVVVVPVKALVIRSQLSESMIFSPIYFLILSLHFLQRDSLPARIMAVVSLFVTS